MTIHKCVYMYSHCTHVCVYILLVYLCMYVDSLYQKCACIIIISICRSVKVWSLIISGRRKPVMGPGVGPDLCGPF